jgi:hypothetical protein
MNAGRLTYADAVGSHAFQEPFRGMNLLSEIVRGVDDRHQPGWVEAEIVDEEGTIREVHDAPKSKKALSRVQLQF